MTDIYHKILQQYWGFTSFRPLQENIIHSVCEGKDTLGLMPTGGGKSLTFQVPVMAMEGLCLVVTPLIALMKDQVDNLKKQGIKALSIYSGMTYQEILRNLENAVLGDYKFLYISPERIATELFLSKLKSMNVCLLVVDESHCISQWGYDFRPSYMNIANIREYLPNVPVLALTATATSAVVKDIQNTLHFKKNNVFRTSFERKNLAYIVRDTENKIGTLLNIISKIDGSAIVYVRSRLKTKEIATELINTGFSADYYHAGLGSDEKVKKQNAWKNNETRIIVSTNAFGMGIDKPDVRLVIHLDLPNSIEEYYQEAGRAGRDGEKAYAVILYTKTDSTKLKKRMADEFPERDFILRIYEVLAYFYQVAEGFGFGTVHDFNLHQFCATYKLPILPTHNALKILDLAGYIEYTDEVDNKSRLIFKIYRDELYDYELDKDSEQLLNTVLRLYTGVFTDYVSIDEGTIAVRLDKNRKDIYELLKLLSKRNIIDYIPYKKTPFIIYKKPRLAIQYVSISKAIYEDRKLRFQQRIEGINDYVERKDVCRSRILLIYFDETDAKDCGHCDVCLAKNEKGLTNFKFDELQDLIHKLLLNSELSVNELINQLPAYRAEDIIKVVRFQADRGVLELTLNKIRLCSSS